MRRKIMLVSVILASHFFGLLMCPVAAFAQIPSHWRELAMLAPPYTKQISDTTNSSQSTISTNRDSSAVQLLNKMFAASGWPTDDSLSDVTIKGTLTITARDGSAHTDNIVIKARAKDEKVSIQNITTGATILRLDEYAYYHDANKLEVVPWLAIEHVYGSFIPFLLPIYHFNDTARELIYQREASPSDASAYVISTRQIDNQQGVRADLRRRASQLKLTVSSTTFLPIQAEIEMTLKNHTARIPTVIRYSNYQHVGGVSIPFTIDVQPNQQASFRILIQNVQWNTGLTDSDFSPE